PLCVSELPMKMPNCCVRVLLPALIAGWLAGPVRAADPAPGWQAHHDAGWKAYHAGRLDEAEKQLRIAAQEARSFGTDDPRMAQTLDRLAWAFAGRGRFADAAPLAQWALGARERRFGPVSAEVAESLNTLACLSEMQEKHADAETYFRRALRVEKKV